MIAIGAWHIQALIRTQQLKKQWKRRAPLTEIEAAFDKSHPAFEAAPTAELLDQANFADAISASVTENTQMLAFNDQMVAGRYANQTHS